MKTFTRKDIESLAKELVEKMEQNKVFTFTGPLGAGKTTLIQTMFKQLGVTGPVQSPTYTYMSVYHLPNNRTFYHFDLYRLNSSDDFITEGFDEYLLKENSWCFIEWPEVIATLLKGQGVHVDLEYDTEDTRLITVKGGK